MIAFKRSYYYGLIVPVFLDVGKLGCVTNTSSDICSAVSFYIRFLCRGTVPFVRPRPLHDCAQRAITTKIFCFIYFSIVSFVKLHVCISRLSWTTRSQGALPRASSGLHVFRSYALKTSSPSTMVAMMLALPTFSMSSCRKS